MNTNHPDSRVLIDYLQQPDAAEFGALRLHLAGCTDCRAQLDVLSSLHNHYPWLDVESCNLAQQQGIEDFVDGRLSDEMHEQVQQQIQNDPAALKAALHYASHAAAMGEEIQHSKQHQETMAKSSFVLNLKSRFRQWFEYQSPVWVSVTAVLVMALTFLVLPMMNPADKNYQIVNYQDNPVIQFRQNDALPGIGFFSKTQQYSQAYGDIQVALLPDKGLRLAWPPVKQARVYNLRLQVFKQGKKNILAEISTEFTHAEINIDSSDLNHRYEWVLSGTTHDDKTFYASGGFVINKLSR